MKNFLVITLLISWSVFSDDETMHKDHESMQMMDHMHHSEHHPSTPVGTTGNMHHMGWMFAIKQGSMSMKGNILDGESISDSDILLRPNEVNSMPNNLSVIPKKMDMEMVHFFQFPSLEYLGRP